MDSMDNFPVCTQCGFTFSEYRSRGLLGCPHCYTSFGDALQADLVWLHSALEISESIPLVKPISSEGESLAQMRQNLIEALKIENYGEAARLRLRIQSTENAGKAGEGIELA